jgi:hypothetical protein
VPAQAGSKERNYKSNLKKSVVGGLATNREVQEVACAGGVRTGALAKKRRCLTRMAGISRLLIFCLTAKPSEGFLGLFDEE